MGYRYPDREYAVIINDTARKSLVSVDNGTISHIWVPCYTAEIPATPPAPARMEVSGMWPPPPPPNIGPFEPVDMDLTERNYDSIDVGLLDPPSGLVFTGSIEYNVIKLTIVAMCPEAEAVDLDVPYCVYAVGTANEYGDDNAFDIRDVVTKGTLRIKAGPITGITGSTTTVEV